MTMPRIMRPDWENALHHVMARGIDGRSLFSNEFEYEDLSRRLEQLIIEMEFSVFAWVIMPNHFHLLIRTGPKPISLLMQRLLTGFAISYNRRHDRTGHVFQGRFRSILVQEETYFLKLINYIHLNPLKAGLVDSLQELDSYKWSGHSCLVGTTGCNWMMRDEVLEYFGDTEQYAIKNYQMSLRNETDNSTLSELAYGNYTINRNGIKFTDQKTKTSHWSGICRVLGNKEFAKKVLSRLNESESMEIRDRGEIHNRIERLFDQVEKIMGLSRDVICGNSRNHELAEARGAIAWICSHKLGLSYRDISKLLAISRSGAAKAIGRGAELKEEQPIIIEKLISQVYNVMSDPD